MARKPVSNQDDLRNQVLHLVRKKKVCDLDDVIQECTSYTWSQVLLEVDELSRSGELSLLYKKPGEYRVKLPQVA